MRIDRRIYKQGSEGGAAPRRRTKKSESQRVGAALIERSAPFRLNQ